MSLGKKAFAAPARLWMNWPLWGGLLAMLLLAKHAWVLFAPGEHAVPSTTTATQPAQAEQLFGSVNTATSTASLSGIRPVGIFASRKNGFAVMQTETGQIGVGVGGQVVPGVSLVETHSDYVVLERNGVRQRVDLGKATAANAAGGAVPVHDAPARGDPASTAQAQMLNQLTPEQRKILQQQQQELIRGKH
jgi:Type II secretion system protein C